MIVFVALAVVIFALMIDVALILLARRQMQAGVNAAATEALRLRDDPAIEDDLDRRTRTTERLAQVYDDDLLATETDSLRFGAGVDVVLDGGVVLDGTTYRASPLVRADLSGPYKPALQLNTINARHGDLVFGQYHARGASEDSAYGREDFLIADDADYDMSLGDTAVLVRLRRTTGPDGVPTSAWDSEPGVSHSGPTVPYVFGRAPLGGSAYLNQRERGAVVRATAIADARPAVVVGLASAIMPTGLAPYWVERAAWQTLPIGAAANVTLDDDGTVTGDLTGEFVVPEVATLGMSLSPTGNRVTITAESHYVAIFDEIEGVRRIVGFGTATLTLDPSDPDAATVVKQPSAVAPVNASAQYVRSLPAMSPVVASTVFEAHRAVSVRDDADPRYAVGNAPLLAPALVRAIP